MAGLSTIAKIAHDPDVQALGRRAARMVLRKVAPKEGAKHAEKQERKPGPLDKMPNEQLYRQRDELLKLYQNVDPARREELDRIIRQHEEEIRRRGVPSGDEPPSGAAHINRRDLTGFGMYAATAHEPSYGYSAKSRTGAFQPRQGPSFAAANHAYDEAHMVAHAPSGKPRGWQNPANQAAIQANRRARGGGHGS